jgi:hypothetical protein
VEVRPEESGNSQVAARELAPELATAIDQELSARARELKKAGIGQDTGDRRVLALLERFGLAGDLPGGAGGNGNGGSGGGRAGGPGWPASGAGAGYRGPAVRGRVNLTVPLATMQGLADRPGELAGHGPVDVGLARRLGGAALAHPGTEVCVIVTGETGVMKGHGCARPPTKAERERLRTRRKQAGPGGTEPPGPALIPMPGNAGGQLHSGNAAGWVLDPGNGQPELVVTIGLVSTDPCEHRLEAAGHDPGTELRHVTNLRYATCTGPACRRPAAQSDWEHNQPFEKGGRSCLCNGNPECRHDHRLKQAPGWAVTQHPDGRIEWRAPTGRTATSEPYRYPT